MKLLYIFFFIVTMLYQFGHGQAPLSLDSEMEVNVTVTACNGWDYGSITNSMQIQLSGINKATEYFYVNKESQLPINGESSLFQVNVPSNIGQLYHAKIMVDDQYGFCISQLIISYNYTNYTFDGPNYFGSGLILASECSYSYRFITDYLPLIQCHPKFLELATYEPRGIYNLDIHSCIGDNNGISAKNMKNNVYAVIMGKKNGEETYKTTKISYLDHIKPSKVNIIQLGELIAGNVLIKQNKENALYSSIEPLDEDDNLLLIGMKLEMIGSNNKFQITSGQNIELSNTYLHPLSKYTFEDGKYFVVFFEDRYSLKTTIPIYIFGGDNVNVNINVFGIFAGHEEKYSLSFQMMDDNRNLINWFDANALCEETYQTHLASIHSEEENFLITGFMGKNLAWMGLRDLTMQGQNNWQWLDQSAVDYENWAPNEPNNSEGEDCGEIYPCEYWKTDGECKWNDLDCNNVERVRDFVCSSPNWPPNTQRTFEINTPEFIDDITLISIGNNNERDNLCIDSVMINSNSASYLSDNNIGGKTGSSSTVTAIIKYPVCKTEVVGFRVDYNKTKANLLKADSSIAGLECKNGNRLISSTCSISQSYELSKTTSFAISNENSATSEYSWGSSSAISFGTSSSTTTSDEFSFGFDQSVTVEVEGDIGIAKVSAEVSVGANQQWTSSTEQSNERSSETSNEKNEQNTDSNTETNAYESAYETSETTTIECAAEIEVPPSHSVKYSLIFNAFNTTINTYTDIKLTLCSPFINPEHVNDKSYYKYINNIPGIINHKETTACEVKFNPAEYIRNNMTCDEEQKLAFASGSNYIPRCQIINPSLYDGCQCDIGDSMTLAQCMCVDLEGNMLTNKLMYVENDDSWQRICVEELSCSDSNVVYNNNNGATIVNGLHTNLHNNYYISNWTIKSLTLEILEVMAILFIIFGMFYIKKYINNNNNKNHKDLKKERFINYEKHNNNKDREERIPIKDNME